MKKAAKVKGKDLRVGMHVCLVKRPGSKGKGNPMPITVIAIEYPYVMFAIELLEDRFPDIREYVK